MDAATQQSSSIMGCTGCAVSSYLKAYTPTSDQHIDPLPWPLEGIELQPLWVFWTDTPYTLCPSWEGTYKTKQLTEMKGKCGKMPHLTMISNHSNPMSSSCVILLINQPTNRLEWKHYLLGRGENIYWRIPPSQRKYSYVHSIMVML